MMKVEILLVIAILLTAGCVQQTQQEEIKIGAMLILTGEGSAWGQVSQRAIDLAVKEANEQGGINGRQIKIIYEDTQGSAAKAVSAYNKLVKVDNVIAIIGPNFQTEMGAIAPLADKDNMPVIAPSYASLSNRPNPKNPLMIWIDPSVEAGKLAEYVYAEGIRNVSVLGTEDSWEKEVSNAFADRFESLGGKVIYIELLQTDDEDVRTTVIKALDKKPEAIYLGTYYQFLNLGRVLKELGYQGGLYSIEVDEYLASESKDFTSGMRFIAPELYKDSFRKKYEEIYGVKSSIPAGQSYDAANILINFLKKSTSREGVLDQMEDFESYDGASGTIEITEDNITIISAAIYELRDGKIIRLQSI